MLTIQQIRARLADRNLRVVAEAIDVHPQSLYRIMNGTEPSYRILRAISEYLEATCRL